MSGPCSPAAGPGGWPAGAAICLGFSLAAWGHGAWLDRNLESYREAAGRDQGRTRVGAGDLGPDQGKDGRVSFVENKDGLFLPGQRAASRIKNTQDRWVVKLKGK